MDSADVGGAGEEVRVGRAGQPAADQMGLEVDGAEDPSNLRGGYCQAEQPKVAGQP
nr:hypothetical protein [Streptomyces acidicola]